MLISPVSMRFHKFLLQRYLTANYVDSWYSYSLQAAKGLIAIQSVMDKMILCKTKIRSLFLTMKLSGTVSKHNVS